jgi:mono/diheme cytochrome c family protein
LWFALVAAAFAAKAQDGPGDRDAGHALAREVCSPCHAIDPPPHAPRLVDIAPDFQAIADTPGMTSTALRAFLLSSHPKMPNFILSRAQSDDVVTYILSLRARPQQGQTRP